MAGRPKKKKNPPNKVYPRGEKPGGRPRTTPIDGESWKMVRTKRRERWAPHKTDEGWNFEGTDLGPASRLTAYLFAFKHSTFPKQKEFLFWEIADMLWNKSEEEPMFAKNKWSWKIIRECCREKYLAIGGAASSGKSYVCAGWGIVNWLCSPSDTLILLTSTDLGGAKKRIFGAVIKLLDLIPDAPMKRQVSVGVLAYSHDGKQSSPDAGIQLIASGKGEGNVGKLIGIHTRNVILIADELTDISPNVQSAAVGNLSRNPSFQMIGLGNPNSRLDPFGVFASPREGWDKVNIITDYEWRTMLNGLYIRINSEFSPNIDREPSLEYPTSNSYEYLPTAESIENDLITMGGTPEEARKSREWMRFCAAVFFDGDGDESYYSEADIIRSGALEKVSLLQPTLIAACDPSFSSGGDGTMVVIMEVGFAANMQHSVSIKKLIPVYEDATNKEDPRTLQMANKIKAICEDPDYKIEPANFAIDATGSGAALADMIELVWKPGLLRVQFGGAASDRRIKNDSKITGKERYKNRASELFFSSRLYLLGRQIYGIPTIIATQMCNRRYEMSKGPKGMMLQVESKKLYKARIGKSPDELDAFMVGVELARVRHLFVALDPPAKQQQESGSLQKWLGSRRTHRSFADSSLGFQNGA